ncbi:hypothetical protein [Paenibacillus segetis]|nr:hypothetical protein [Paenibacillus segetis]
MNEMVTESEEERLVESILSNCENQVGELAIWNKKHKFMYPHFLLPSYEESNLERSKKLRLITGELPKTFLLSHNAYELEALRILAIRKHENAKINELLEATTRRLENTCFGHFCSEGECLWLSLVVVRFWNTFKPYDLEKINNMLLKIIDHITNTTKRAVPSFYLWLTLSELADNSEYALEFIKKNSRYLVNQFQKGWIVNPKNADRYNPLRKHIIKNTLIKTSMYQYMKDAEVHISNDGRCYGK